MSSSNLQYWKELVGLEDTDFPQLIEVDKDNIDKAAIVATRMMAIAQSLQAADQETDCIQRSLVCDLLRGIHNEPGRHDRPLR